VRLTIFAATGGIGRHALGLLESERLTAQTVLWTDLLNTIAGSGRRGYMDYPTLHPLNRECAARDD
jgi:hypothetical protein